MLNFDSATALEGYKQGIVTNVALQKAMGNNAVDTSDINISIFGYKVRRDINYNAERCNTKSGALGTLQPEQEYNSIKSLCDGVDKNIQALQNKVEWAQKAGQDILEIPGLSDQAKSQTVQTINETVQFGHKIIVKTVNAVNEAISQLKSATNNSTPETVTKSVQNTQKTINTTVKKVSTDSNITNDINTQATKETSGDKKDTKAKDIPANIAKDIDTTTKNIHTDIAKDIDTTTKNISSNINKNISVKNTK